MKIRLSITSTQRPTEPATAVEILGISCTIGRVAGEVVLQDPLCSTTHAMLLPHENRLWLCDHLSTNGTFVNKVRITKTAVKEGDHIRIGNTLITILHIDLAAEADHNTRTHFHNLAEPHEQMTNIYELKQLRPSQSHKPVAKKVVTEKAKVDQAPLRQNR